MGNIFRGYLRNTSFTLTIVITLTLSIGSTITVFALVSGLFFKPLPFPESQRLVSLAEWDKRGRRIPVSGQDFQDWQQDSHSFEKLSAYAPRRAKIEIGQDVAVEQCADVTPGFFETLGMAPKLGRAFSLQDDQQGNELLVMIGDRLWQRLGSPSDITGISLRIDDQSYSVLGVMPPGFDFPRRAEFWLIKVLSKDNSQRGGRYLSVLGRLKPATDLKAASTEMDLIARRLVQQYPESNTGIGISAISLKDYLFGNLKTTTFLLFAAALLLFLVGSVNALHLHLARTVARQQEFATRMALGASSSQVMKQLAAEITPLILIGAAAGLAMSRFGLVAISRFMESRLPSELRIGMDAWVILFTLALFIILVTASAVVSGRRASRMDFATALKADGRLSGERHQGSISSSFVSTQVAFSLTLLIMSFAIVLGLLRLEEVHPGFEQESILTFRVNLANKSYQDSTLTPFYQNLMRNLHSLPGVADAGGVDILPLASPGIRGYARKKDEMQAPVSSLTAVGYRIATPEYFNTLGIRLHEGRFFTEADAANAAKVVIVNDEAAKRLWPGQSAIGRSIQLHNSTADWLTVIGVVANNKEGDLREADQPLAFETYLQRPTRTLYVAVRSEVSSLSLLPAIRNQIKLLDPHLPLADVSTMKQVVRDSLSSTRLQSGVVGIFSACAIGLTIIGVYAFISYATRQRTQEIGIRVALGAQRSQIFWMISKEALRLALIGIAAGLITAFLFIKFFASQYWGMPAPDVRVIILACMALVVVSLVASFAPAMRAARLDPLCALRGEK